MRIDDRRQTDWDHDTSFAPSAPRTGTSSVRDDLLPEWTATQHESPELLAFFAGLRAHAAGGTATDAVSASAADAAREKQVQAKLDVLRDQYSGPYSVAGKQVTARPMFRMASEKAFNNASMIRNRPTLDAAAKKAGIDAATVSRVVTAVGTPKDVVRVTQALIDAGFLPEGDDVDRCIRDMQWTFGIGIDCATFTYRAFEATTGKSGASCGLKPYGTEGFRFLDSNGAFKKQRPSDVRAGDIITLDGPGGATGHNVMVRAHRVVDVTRQHELESKHGNTARQFFAGPGPFHAIQVDSSWGTGSRAEDYGGYRSDTWFYDEGSKKWASVEPASGKLVISDAGPSGDLFHGAYRPKGGA